MKSGKAGGLTQWAKKAMKIRDMVSDEGKLPRDWKLNTLSPIYKGKGDLLECGSYWMIKLLEGFEEMFFWLGE